MSQLQHRDENQNFILNFVFQFIKKKKKRKEIALHAKKLKLSKTRLNKQNM